jgi:predicted RNA methylase
MEPYGVTGQALPGQRVVRTLQNDSEPRHRQDASRDLSARTRSQLHQASRKACACDHGPFLGLGNSAIAAAQCGASEFIGFEIDSEYLAVASKRAGEALNPPRRTSTTKMLNKP